MGSGKLQSDELTLKLDNLATIREDFCCGGLKIPGVCISFRICILSWWIYCWLGIAVQIVLNIVVEIEKQEIKLLMCYREIQLLEIIPSFPGIYLISFVPYVNQQ